ncbi:stress response protein nhax [Plakobranchus ocellatus]|uniref:Stress response protein nhax n=1 Tax=Plakobranchus ocellatus TaxID=259542 RepID=A0AAV4BRT3_9GAST|nr:stress response protein nhax [Plakobranchus ocellatus]
MSLSRTLFPLSLLPQSNLGFCKHIHREGDRVILVYVPELNDLLHSSKWSSSVYVFDREVMEAMLEEEQARIRKDLDAFAQKLKQHGLGGKVKSVMASKPGEGILKAADEEKADMIVVGSRGLSTLRRTLMGSVSDYLVHHAHIPVAVCKHPHHLHDLLQHGQTLAQAQTKME